MEDFFATLYEFFGLGPVYSNDLGDLLRGWDATCTDYMGTPWYVYLGFGMIALSAFCYALQYHLLDNSRFNKRMHWWMFALALFLVNFGIAFSVTYNILNSGDYCSQLKLNAADCIGFGLSNAVWSFLVFMLLSSSPYPRRLSTNCRHTTFITP